ncbi:hypothetical protein BpHYR1_005308 [Brachionus plicatilis]|uniref:Uncharacterized protein n=1 Tax=Brachionus plicatilis TaxID=10195 RepID=A0A3M7RFR1_BRAPC|nr:hypothetical protein BpHYR1_005308 [Brachionus plicatilis]
MNLELKLYSNVYLKTNIQISHGDLITVFYENLHCPEEGKILPKRVDKDNNFFFSCLVNKKIELGEKKKNAMDKR